MKRGPVVQARPRLRWLMTLGSGFLLLGRFLWNGPAHRSKRQNHWHQATIEGILRVCPNQISLLKPDRDQDVSSCGEGKDQVRHSHHGSRPEYQQPSHVQRVPHNSVRPGSSEIEWRIGYTA